MWPNNTPDEGKGKQPDYTRTRALRAALALAERGRPVFPTKHAPDKGPLTWNGFKDASTDRQRITAMWNGNPGASIGMPCGKVSGIVTIDLDTKRGEDGPGEFAKLVRERGEPLPRTRTVRTPSGEGRHLAFTYSGPLPSSKNKLGPGIEVKADGTYVLVAPSPGYVVVDPAPPAPLPEWLVELIVEPKKPKPPTLRRDGAQTTLYDFLEGPSILEGSRHDTMTSLGGRLQDGSRSAEELLRDLHAINDARCTPPLPVSEVNAIAEWASLREPCSSGRPAALVALVGRLSEAWYRMERRGLGGKGEVRMLRMLLEEGARYGSVVEDGLRVSISLRQMSEVLSCGVGTVRAVRDRLAARGLLLVDNSEVGRRTATGTGSAALVLIARDEIHTPPTDSLLSRGVGGGVSKSSRPSAATLNTGHYRHLGPVGYSREDTLCHVETHPGSTRETLAALMGWSRPRDLEARHLRPLAEVGLIEEDGGRWSVADRYAEAQADTMQIAYSTIQMRSARQWDQEAQRWVHFVAETGSVASQQEREKWDIERHRQQRALWKLTLAEKKAAAEEATQPGPVIVEHDGALVDAETGEVVGVAVRSGWVADEPTDRTQAA